MEWIENWAQEIKKGNRSLIAKAITLVGSTSVEDAQRAHELLYKLQHIPPLLRAYKVGISGPPGVGKSSLIEALGKWLIEKGKKVAVLTVDPSSQVTGGSILGDKTRMPFLSQHPNAFVRTEPAKGSLGGIASGTASAITVVEAAGFDTIFIETVGVGQSESNLARLVDIFVLLMQPGSGDELQAMKRGVQELAHFWVVTKHDGEQKELAEKTIRTAKTSLAISHHRTQVLSTSIFSRKSLEDLWRNISQAG